MAYELPRRWWVLVIGSIALFALSGGLRVLAQAYDDIYDLGVCDAYKDGTRSPRASLQECEDTRLMAAAAGVGERLTEIPAIGLLLISFGILLLSWRQSKADPGQATPDARRRRRRHRRSRGDAAEPEEPGHEARAEAAPVDAVPPPPGARKRPKAHKAHKPSRAEKAAAKAPSS